ncbi:MAG: rplX [Candidatus Berkelbacteria bacterium]|nr:rplX [Candidatus Berkelbacteria bacterium]
MRLKKGDQVLIIAGKDSGKRGTVDKILSKENKIMVIGINIAKHHLKPSRKNPHGGIIDKLAPFDASNAIIICPRCSNPTRVSYKITEMSVQGGSTRDRKKIRICKKCKESLDKE